MASGEIFAIISEVSKMLLEHGFSPKNVSMALSKVGKALKVDRVYVFENDHELQARDLTLSQRYEWSAVSAEPQLDNPELQNLPYKDAAPSYQGPLSRGEHITGIVRKMPSPTRELLESQNIKSILICPIIMDAHEWWGLVGFDDCRNERVWPSEEIAVLKTLSRALAGALRHKEVHKRFSSVQSQLRDAIQRCSALVG